MIDMIFSSPRYYTVKNYGKKNTYIQVEMFDFTTLAWILDVHD